MPVRVFVLFFLIGPLDDEDADDDNDEGGPMTTNDDEVLPKSIKNFSAICGMSKSTSIISPCLQKIGFLAFG